jgi:hypothetical protein
VKARAYASLPGRPAIVNGVSALFVPLDIAVPLVLAVISSELGSPVAMLALATAPLALAIGAVLGSRRR